MSKHFLRPERNDTAGVLGHLLRQQDDPLAGARSLSSACNKVLAAASAVPTTLYVQSTLAADGVQPFDLALSALLGAGMLLGTMTTHHWGLHVIARERPARRRRMNGVFWPVCFALFATSVGTGVSYIAAPRAEQAEHTVVLQRVDEDIVRLNDALARIQGTDTILQNAQSGIAALLKSETANGGVCQTGGGLGPCVSELEGQAATAQAARDALAGIEARAAPLRRSITVQRAEIAQALNNDRLSRPAQIDAIEAGVEGLGVKLDALKSLAPVQVLETASSNFARPFDQLGLPTIGAERLKAQLEPYGKQIDLVLDDVRSPLAMPLVQYKEKTALEMIADNFGAVAFIVLILIAIDAIPLMLIALFMAAAPRDELHPSFLDGE